tara:strand:- start:29 stop:529 length:501 start_codon:yes stop_codon:yes gene_type:complete
MLHAINCALATSFLAVLCSPLWKNVYKDSGLKRRLLSHILFLPIYITIEIILLGDGKLSMDRPAPSLYLPLFNGLFFYGVVFFLYESVLSKVERSVTVKIFLRIYQSQKIHNKATLINEEEELFTRIEGLLREKFIEKRNNRYRVTEKGALNAKILSSIRSIFWIR